MELELRNIQIVKMDNRIADIRRLISFKIKEISYRAVLRKNEEQGWVIYAVRHEDILKGGKKCPLCDDNHSTTRLRLLLN